MKRKLTFVAAAMLFVNIAFACTNILVSKGASKDGSVMVTYSADAGGFCEPLYYQPARDWKTGDSLTIYEWDTGKKLGKIKQIAHTYQVVGNMNEWQVAIGETTFGGRSELYDPKAILDYGSLMYIALQRSKTAREAIKVMTELVAEYGYASSGESMSVADANEVWIFEIISKGTKEKGAVWAARRVPEGYICAHANHARIREIPKNDLANCIFSPDVESFAIQMGFYDPKLGKPFRFVDAYDPDDPGNLKYCEGRVWSIFNRAAPSQAFKSEFWRGVVGAEPYPLFIKADKKLAVEDVMALMRDHFEGTPWDMTKEPIAGPYGNPIRWKPLAWKLEGDTASEYGWERPISTQQTNFSFVSQSRANMPREIGGCFWYGLDDTYATCYMPLYCGITAPPKDYMIAKIDEFNWNSPWWVFNLLNNYSYSKYSYIIKDILKVQKEIEEKFIADQPAIEAKAAELYKSSPKKAVEFLTKYSSEQAAMVFERWKQLAGFVFAKYNDGYVNNMNDGGRSPRSTGYGNKECQRAIQDDPVKYRTMWRNKLK
ncbi:MAG: C69 family dipeptidase [Bacteroidota bacterium]